MPKGYASLVRSAAVGLAVLLVAGNALVRGGVDLAAIAISALLAAAALALAPRLGERERIAVPALVVGLGVAVAFIALQLVPLPAVIHRAVSPRTAATLDEALAPLGLWPAWRPLSLHPAATALELAKAAALSAVAAAAAILGGSRRRQRQLLRGLALSGVAVAVAYYGAALLGLSPLVAPRVTFVNTNHLAGFLQLAAWPALGFALGARGQARAGWLAAFAFSASGVFLSLSRAGIAAFFVAAGIFAILRMRAASPEAPPLPGPLPPLARGRSGLRGLVRSGRVVAAGGIAAALAVAAWLALDPILAELRTVGDERTSAVKLGLWPAAATIAGEFPLVGIGRGAFATVYPAYKTEPAQLTFTHVENEWLQLPVELGIVGLAVVALFAWAFVAAARRRDLFRPLAGALAGAGAVAAHNLFDFSLEIPGVAIPFALVMGIAARHMPGLSVRPIFARVSGAVLLVVAGAGLLVHGRAPSEASGETIAAASTADEAAARARDALSWSPADWVPQAVVGARLAGEGRCREALPWLTRAMLRNPTAPEPHRSMAGCLARAGQDAFAKREYRLAYLFGDRTALAEAFGRYDGPGELLAIAPDTPAGLRAAGTLLRSRPAEAAVAWGRAWESFGDADALASLADAKLALGEAEEALSLARRVQEVSPRLGAGYVHAARALEALGRPDDALKELELGASRLPGSAAVLVPLGNRHLARRRFSQARAVFDGIVAKDGPALAQKRVLVARALEGQGRYGEALREAQVAREIAPGDVGALDAFARLAALVGRYDEAIEAIELAARAPSAKAGAYEARLAALRAARDEQRVRRGVQGLDAK